jgi:hypothetical protein
MVVEDEKKEEYKLIKVNLEKIVCEQWPLPELKENHPSAIVVINNQIELFFNYVKETIIYKI